MRATGWLIRHQLRRRAPALGVLALVTALGTTGTLVAAGASNRTADAYAAYRQRADVGDVVVNPSVASAQIDQLIRSLPGVEAVTSDGLFTAGIGEPGPLTQAQIDAETQSYLVRGSFDGRYDLMDRPAVADGHLPTGTAEIFASADVARAEHLAVGDVVPMAFFPRSTELTGATGPITPVVVPVTVAGTGALPEDVLPDGLYLQGTVILSPDLARRFDCLPALPGPDATIDEVNAVYAPPECSTSYRFWSIALRDGDDGVPAALQAFSDGADALASTLPAALVDMGFGYTLVGATTTATTQARVDRSTDPIVVALGVLAGASGAITLLLVGLGAARELSRADGEQRSWWRLGLTTRERTRIVGVPILLAIGIGVLVGLVGAWSLSTVGPVGTVRAIDPSPTRQLSGVAGIVALGVAVALVLVSTTLTWRAARRVTRRSATSRSSVARRLVRRSTRPEVAEGVRAAYQTNRGVGLVLASGGVAVGVFVAAVVFGSSLSRVLSSPSAYGWQWDVGTIDNYGYGGIELDRVHQSLDQRPDVERWTALGFSTSMLLDDEQVAALIAFDRSSTVDLTVVDGTLPTQDDQVALGARTARDRGLHVGDAVTVRGYEVEPRSATVSGIVVLPALGPFQSDRTAPGVGLLVPEAMLNADAVALGPTFVGIELRPGVDRAATLADLHDDILGWYPNAINTFDRTTPARPPEIIDARSMRESPVLVGGLLVVGATVGLVVAIAMSVRARRRDLAVLRVLGFTDHQLRRSVLVQAIASVVGAVVIGVPLGIAAGRVAWRSFASRLGVLTSPRTPLVWIAVTIVGAAVVALIAGALPARSAARTRPAVTLRTE